MKVDLSIFTITKESTEVPQVKNGKKYEEGTMEMELSQQVPSLFYKVSRVSSLYYTPELVRCLSSNDPTNIRRLLQPYDPKTTYDSFLDTPLHVSARYKDSNYTLDLIRMGYPVNKINCFGLTPLHCALMSGSVESVKALVQRDATFNTEINSWNFYLNERKDVIKFMTEYFLQKFSTIYQIKVTEKRADLNTFNKFKLRKGSSFKRSGLCKK